MASLRKARHMDLGTFQPSIELYRSNQIRAHDNISGALYVHSSHENLFENVKSLPFTINNIVFWSQPMMRAGCELTSCKGSGFFFKDLVQVFSRFGQYPMEGVYEGYDTEAQRHILVLVKKTGSFGDKYSLTVLGSGNETEMRVKVGDWKSIGVDEYGRKTFKCALNYPSKERRGLQDGTFDGKFLVIRETKTYHGSFAGLTLARKSSDETLNIILSRAMTLVINFHQFVGDRTYWGAKQHFMKLVEIIYHGIQESASHAYPYLKLEFQPNNGPLSIYMTQIETTMRLAAKLALRTGSDETLGLIQTKNVEIVKELQEHAKKLLTVKIDNTDNSSNGASSLSSDCGV